MVLSSCPCGSKTYTCQHINISISPLFQRDAWVSQAKIKYFIFAMEWSLVRSKYIFIHLFLCLSVFAHVRLFKCQTLCLNQCYSVVPLDIWIAIKRFYADCSRQPHPSSSRVLIHSITSCLFITGIATRLAMLGTFFFFLLFEFHLKGLCKPQPSNTVRMSTLCPSEGQSFIRVDPHRDELGKNLLTNMSGQSKRYCALTKSPTF